MVPLSRITKDTCSATVTIPASMDAHLITYTYEKACTEEPYTEVSSDTDEMIRSGNNKAHRSKAKRIQEKKMKRNSKKRNRK